jgi:BirA family biotin operon repressor/biotin-[acetyl-CoA-carboxylase] ligase
MEWRVQRFPILASTNDLALGLMRAGAASAGDVWVADEQSAGRGRRGRSWHSTRGALMFTAALQFYPERAGWTALAAGCAVAAAVRDLGAPASVKWPNDVLVGGRKLAGVLVESCVPALAAVGIGLNVTNALPPDEALLCPATRLEDHLPGVGLELVLDRVLAQLAAHWELLRGGDLAALHRIWNGLDTTRGRRVRWSYEAASGTALGIEESGALRLHLDDGRLVSAVVGEIDFVA